MAARYWVGGTGNWDTTTTANWSATSGGAGGASVPTAADDVFIDANSGVVTVTKTTSTSCLTLTFTGFTGTWIIANGITLTVVGTAITLGSGMTYDQTTTGILSTTGNQAAITITFAGITIPNLTCGRTSAGQIQTVTISGTTPTVRNLIFSNGATNANTTLAGTALTITSSFSLTLGTCSGTLLTFSGTCTISNAGGNILNSITVASGSLQMLTNINKTGPSTITFSAGTTLNPGLFTLALNSGVVTFNTSGVTWYRIVASATGQIHNLLSNLNISNDFFCTAGQGFTGAFSINIGGSFIITAGSGLSLLNNAVINMTGTGTIEAAIGATIFSGTFNITGSGNYVLGSVSRPNLVFQGVVLNLVGTSTANVYSTSGHTLVMNGATITTNNTPTGANIVGGSEIIWGNILLTSNQPVTLTYETTALGNLTANNNAINGAKLYVAGNLSVTTQVLGTSTIELNGSNSTTWSAGTCQNSIIINKSGAGSVTLPAGTITWGAAGRILQRTAGNINAGTSTVSIPNAAVTVNNMIFNNLTVTGGATITQNALNTINGLLLLNGTTTFLGTHGFTTQNLTCTTAASTITLQNINANPLAEYRVNGVLTLLGTLASRIVLQAAGSATFNGTITPVGQLNYLSGTAPSVGMTVSQSTGVSPAGLIGLLPNRPVITGGVSPTFTISPSATAIIGVSFSMRAGFKAKFILTNNGTSTQNVAYVQTQDIDSNDGVTILSFGSNGDDVNNSTIALFRTLNWGPLFASSGSTAYTWVD